MNEAAGAADEPPLSAHATRGTNLGALPKGHYTACCVQTKLPHPCSEPAGSTKERGTYLAQGARRDELHRPASRSAHGEGSHGAVYWHMG